MIKLRIENNTYAQCPLYVTLSSKDYLVTRIIDLKSYFPLCRTAIDKMTRDRIKKCCSPENKRVKPAKNYVTVSALVKAAFLSVYYF